MFEAEISNSSAKRLELKKDKRTKMIITNYSFFSVLLNKKVFSPIRWFIENGVGYPLKDNKYFPDFKLIKLEDGIKQIFNKRIASI